MKRIVITGGAGFIGSHIAELFLSRGYEVTVIDNRPDGRGNVAHLGDKIRFVKGDILDRDLLIAETKGVAGIIHHAAFVSVPASVADPVTSHAINVSGTVNVLEAARINHVPKVVQASSSAVYGDDAHFPKIENSIGKPQSPYGAQKRMAELYAQLFSDLYGTAVVSLRYFNVFGPKQDPNGPYSAVIPLFIKKALAGESVTINGDGTATRDFIYVKDIALANLAAFEQGKTGIYNIGSGVETSLNDMVEKISSALGKKLEAKHGPDRKGDIVRSVSDISLAAKELGFTPKTTFDEGLKETVEWFRSHC